MSVVHYRQEVIRIRDIVVDLVSRNSTRSTIPIPAGILMYEVIEARDVLNDSSWEVAGFQDGFVWFKRYIAGEYAG